MKTFYLCFISILGFTSIVNSQVIYERIFSRISPSDRFTIQLSDTSSICFGTGYECNFAPFHHIDPNGNIINSVGFSLESTHSSGARTVGLDSVLFWNRVGTTDHMSQNYLQISLWTPDQLVTLVLDSLHYQFWEDQDIPYEAYLFKNDKVVYRKADSLYVVEVSKQQLLNKVVLPGLGNVNPFLDYIVAFPFSADPIIFSIDLMPMATWQVNQHPINHYEQMALDSFLIGFIPQQIAKLHVVNGLTEVNFDLDLSGYFTSIEDVQVNEQGLFVKGKKGAVDYLVQINEQFHVVNETAIDLPDLDRPFTFTYYSDRVYASTTDGISQYQAEYRMSYHFTDPNPVRYVDISLDTIWVDSVFYWPPDLHVPANLFLLAKITNHSPDTLHSFTYHFESQPVFFCDPGVYPGYVNDLSIPPGETGIVPFTTWSWEVAEHEPFFRTFYVEHANHHLDDQEIDNHFTLFYFLSSLFPIQENSFSVWPNPFNDYIETSEEFRELKLYDQLGRIVTEGSDRLDNLERLIPGTYIVQGIKNQQAYFSKVVKSE